VPPAVLEREAAFYRCGNCGQIFWAGAKYENTMDSLRAVQLGDDGFAKNGGIDDARDCAFTRCNTKAANHLEAKLKR